MTIYESWCTTPAGLILNIYVCSVCTGRSGVRTGEGGSSDLQGLRRGGTLFRGSLTNGRIIDLCGKPQ